MCKHARSWRCGVGVPGYLRSMQYEEVAALRAGSPAWRLLRADNAPLVLSFLGRVFVEENVRDISATQLDRLGWTTSSTRSTSGSAKGRYPKSAKAYLDDWASPEVGLAAKVLSCGLRRTALRRDRRRSRRRWRGCDVLARPILRRHRIPAQHHLRAAAADGVRRRNRPGRGWRSCSAGASDIDDEIAARRGRRLRSARPDLAAGPLPAVRRDGAGAARRLP